MPLAPFSICRQLIRHFIFAISLAATPLLLRHYIYRCFDAIISPLLYFRFIHIIRHYAFRASPCRRFHFIFRLIFAGCCADAIFAAYAFDAS